MLGCRRRCRRHRPGRHPGRGLGAQPVAHLGAQHADHSLHLLVTHREQKGGGAAIPVGRGRAPWWALAFTPKVDPSGEGRRRSVHTISNRARRSVIGGHQRAHQPQSEVSSAAIRGLVRFRAEHVEARFGRCEHLGPGRHLMSKAINRYHQHLRPRRHLMSKAINRYHQSHSALISAHSAARRPQLHAFRTCGEEGMAPW